MTQIMLTILLNVQALVEKGAGETPMLISKSTNVVKLNSMKTITYKELMRLGFAKTTARKIIQQVKNIAIKRFEVADKNSINTVKLSKSHSILICPLSSRQVISKNSVCFIRSVVQINVLLTFFMQTT